MKAKNNDHPYLFVPSYHRADNLKTCVYYKEIGYDMSRVVVFIDSEAEDVADYQKSCAQLGCKLHVFNMTEARARYDYVHRASVSRRSAGQARNMFYDYARANGIDFYVVSDDDTRFYEKRDANGVRHGEQSGRIYDAEYLASKFNAMRDFMSKRHIGVMGFPQGGDFIGGKLSGAVIWKVMNTTFVLTKYVYRPERGVQDDDTSAFVGMYNEGLFTCSVSGISLEQMASATAKGGLTDLYHECKLLNKSLVTPIQFPSAINAEKQSENGGRLHHRIRRKYLAPMLIKGTPDHDNIAWDKYAEDFPFTNEPWRKIDLNDTDYYAETKNTNKDD